MNLINEVWFSRSYSSPDKIYLNHIITDLSYKDERTEFFYYVRTNNQLENVNNKRLAVFVFVQIRR